MSMVSSTEFLHTIFPFIVAALQKTPPCNKRRAYILNCELKNY